MSLKEQTAEIVKYWRGKRGITQRELAQRSGIGLSTIRELETSVNAPRLETIYKIAKALEINAELITAPLWKYWSGENTSAVQALHKINEEKAQD